MRIISLLPEATAILAQLGVPCEPLHRAIAAGEVAFSPYLYQGADMVFAAETWAGGYPRWLVRKTIAQLRPRPAVYALEPHTLGDVLSDIKTVGDATGQQRAARALIERQRARIDAVTLRTAHAFELAGSPPQRPPRRVALLASREPPIAAGWWLAELIGLAGGHDVLGGQSRPARLVTQAEIEAARPEIVVSVDELGNLPTPWNPSPPDPLSLINSGAPPFGPPQVVREMGSRLSVPPSPVCGRGGRGVRGSSTDDATMGYQEVGGSWPDPVRLLEELACLLSGVATQPS